MYQVCGFSYIHAVTQLRQFLPQVSLKAHATIVASVSRTTLTQTFVNPSSVGALSKVQYTFPLYDGASVVAFTCKVAGRTIKGVVKERAKARATFEAAAARGEAAGLLEQSTSASDVFTTSVANIPAGAEIVVEITYLGELKHDAEVDGIRFTIPTRIAPRYGNYPGELAGSGAIPAGGAKAGMEIVVDAHVPKGSAIKAVQSPSHPIAVSIGTLSTSRADAEPSLQMASASLSLGSAELEKDFVLHVVATNAGNPTAVLETHPTLPDQRALMATLVPRFALPPSRPEVVFVIDRSGSMSTDNKMPNVVSALQLFLKSLPVGVKFNLCSFGSSHTFLWDKSRAYDATTLAEASKHVAAMHADYGGTEIARPIEDVFKRRYADMDLEVFLLTDGEVWDQATLFTMVNRYVGESKGAVRVFTLGVGVDVSHALIEGVARAGNGFAQTVAENEKMDAKVVRMLRAALSPHVTDYQLELKYGDEKKADGSEDDFDIIDKVADGLVVVASEPEEPAKPAAAKKPISLFDMSANVDAPIGPTAAAAAESDETGEAKYAHLPAIAAPKYLQTPHAIPPLFSFSRTTVYVLLSGADANRRTPTAVLLKGTSPQGPLELEIPVTVLDEKATTIHGLAASKAVTELEEGRGWLAYAKDGKDEGAKLLKDKYPGRFSDMVEREAVRLGVRFQVGGKKWCSWVAVEAKKKAPAAGKDTKEAGSTKADAGDGDAKMRDADEVTLVERPKPSDKAEEANEEASAIGFLDMEAEFDDDDADEFVMRHATVGAVASRSRSSRATPSAGGGTSLFSTGGGRSARGSGGGGMGGVFSRLTSAAAPPAFSSGGGLFGVHRAAAGPPPPAPTPQMSAFSGGGGLFGVQQAAAAAPPPAPTPQMSAYSGGSLFGVHQAAAAAPMMDQQQLLQAQPTGALFFGGPGGALAPADRAEMKKEKKKGGGGGSSSGLFGASLFGSSSASPAPPPRPAAEPSVARKSAVSPRRREGGGPMPAAAVASQQQQQAAVLERLVALQTFEGSWEWSAALCALLGVSEAAAAGAAGGGADAADKNVVATALVLLYLKKRLGKDRDSWDMLADKARAWVQAKGVDLEELERKLETVF